MKRSLWVAGVLAALLAAGLAYLHLRSPSRPPAPSEKEIKRLEEARDALESRYEALFAPIARAQGRGEAPEADVLIGIPNEFVKDVIEQFVTGFLGDVTLTLKDLKVHHEDDVKAKVLFAERKLGDFVVDLDLHRTQGRLKPGKPRVSFGRNRIGVVLPVTLVEGATHAAIRFRWNSKGIAGLLCGDLDVTREVTGTVVPESYEFNGGFVLAAEGGSIVATPQFGEEVRFRLHTKATPQSWAVVDQVIEDQPSLCRTALKKIDVKQKLEEILAGGFSVKLPREIFRPILLPAGVEQSLLLQGMTLSLQVKAIGLVVTPQRVWYGADVATQRGAAASR